MGQFAQIAALLLGSGALMLAGGINGLLLPLRGAIEGFSDLSLGLLGTGWAIGYVSGCLFVPQLVGRVGHIRSFSVMAGLAAVSILLSLLLLYAPAWILLRGLAGFCFSGGAMIVESWLNERTEPSQRGRVFGLYTMINLAAMTVGQMVLTFGDPGGYTFFVLAAVFYALALLPTSVTQTIAPQPMVSARLDLGALWRNSPLAVLAVVLVGASNSAFGTLGAVYAGQIGLDTGAIAVFVSIAVVTGAVLQLPVGALSDRVDRRYVLLGLAVLAAAVDACFVFLQPTAVWAVVTLSALFGAAVFGMYPVIVAHANDHAPEGYFLKTSGGLLLLFGCGSIAGPLVAGAMMGLVGTNGLYVTTLGVHALMIAVCFVRLGRRAAPSDEEKGRFRPAPSAIVSTPQTAVLNPVFEGTVAEDAIATVTPAPDAQAADDMPLRAPHESV